MKSFLEKRPLKSPKVASRVINGEAVAVIPQDGAVNILSEVASLIWELSNGEKSLDEIADIVACEFDVDRESAAEDIKDFVEDLLGKGMIELY